MKTMRSVTEVEQMSKFSKEDLDLVQSLKAGNKSAFNEIYKRYHKFIKHYCFLKVKDQRIAGDLTNEILTKAYLNIDKYTFENTFNSWVWRIVNNHVIDYVRRKHKNPVDINMNYVIQEGSFIDSEESNSSEFKFVELGNLDYSPGEILEKKQRDKKKQEFLMNLFEDMKDIDRKIIMYYYFDDMSYEEIAAKLNIGLSKMKVRLLRAKERLKSKIGSYETVSSLFA